MNVSDWIEYCQRVRIRTTSVMDLIPPEKIDWSYKPGKFTLGDTLRHIAVVERFMFIETLCGRPSTYIGQDKIYGENLADISSFMSRMHLETIAILSSFSDDQLNQRCMTPSGDLIVRWKWIRAMLEHEIHHRGQLYTYLNILGIETKPMFAMSSEQLVAYAKKREQ
jgi:uncharacterized damage-inducible protein DinB